MLTNPMIETRIASGLPMLEMRGITKRFPGVLANEDVTLQVQYGQVHTLLGENGAGKSTLMNILYGLHRPDAGSIHLHGDPVPLESPTDAIEYGIGMIHQHFKLVPNLTVAENVALGLGSKWGWADMGPIKQQMMEVADQYGLALDPDAYIWQLTVGERQRAEIVKMLYRKAEILILDEPTAVLTPPEVEELFATMRHMVADGRSLIFISHKLSEVLDISDQITVLRDGRVTGQADPQATSEEKLAELMVGRPISFHLDIPAVEVQAPKLEVRGLTVKGDRGTTMVKGLSFAVGGGEIVGIAGVSGNGQREIAEGIVGLRPLESGEVVLDGTVVPKPSPALMRAMGLSYTPEERMVHGAIGDFTVAENLILVDYKSAPFSRGGLLKTEAIKMRSRELVQDYRVKTPSLSTPTRHLSGGNIHKVVLAREFTAEADVLIVAEITRGLDIGAVEDVKNRLLEQRSQGKAILLISSDLDTIIQLSDRILVILKGEIMGEVLRNQVEVNRLGLLMSGVRS